MQREIFVQGELTGQGPNAYSRGRSNFMPNEGGEAPKSPQPIVRTQRFGEARRIEEASSRLVRAKVEGEAPSIVIGPDGLPLNWNEWNLDSRRAWMEVQRDRAGEQLLGQQISQREDPHDISPAQKEALGKVYAMAQDDPEAFGESYVRAIDTLSQKRAEPIVHGDTINLVKQALEGADIPESSKKRFLKSAERALVLTPPETARSIRRIMKAIPKEPQRLEQQATRKATREAAAQPAEQVPAKEEARPAAGASPGAGAGAGVPPGRVPPTAEGGPGAEEPDPPPIDLGAAGDAQGAAGAGGDGTRADAGGADILAITDYPDPRLNNIVREINAEANRVGRGNPLDATSIDRHIRRIQGLVDNSQVDNAQALNLLNQLNIKIAETRTAELAARLAQQAEFGRYFSAEDERAILTDEDERERIFEEIFVGVDAQPGKQFRDALSLEASGKLDHFFTLLNHTRVFVRDHATGNNIEVTDIENRQAEVTKARDILRAEFSARVQIREALHNANWSVSGGGDINAFAQALANFPSEHVDLIFQDGLVETALHMFEQSFQQIKADNGGQLPYEEIAWNPKTNSSKLEGKVWDLMRRQVSDDVPEWRLRRAIILARGFGVATLRFPEIAAQARLPEAGPMSSATERASRFGSIYGEAIARYLDPIEHIIEKFAIGEEDRAFLYYFLTGDKGRFQSKEQLQLALEMSSHLTGEDKRLIDVINIFRIGGPFSQSSWRAFMAMKNERHEPATPEQVRKSGIGIREARLSGDVDDEIRAEVRRDPKFAGRSDEEMEKEAQSRIKDKSKIETENKKFKVEQRRLEMWKDVLKSNPLRVMWQWEERVPGQRIKFLSEALGITEDNAKALLPQVEEDLMIIQEDTVRRLKEGTITYNDPEMLDYNLIGGANPTPKDLTRRTNAQRYVEKIRGKAAEGKHAFLRSLFDKTPADRSPFPFVIGFEDLPFTDLDFINTGGRGFIARRINDYAASVTATNELIGLIAKIPNTHNIEPLIDSLDKIKKAVEQYDKSMAMEIVPYIARGIVRFYDKGLAARLPLGIGTVVGLLSDSSYAQKVFGREAMSWDEGDKFNFTRHLLLKGLATKSEISQMRKELGATLLHEGIDAVRSYGQLALLLLLWHFTKVTAKDTKL